MDTITLRFIIKFLVMNQSMQFL